jgi:glycerophosphoryl diester phosphodiesterase
VGDPIGIWITGDSSTRTISAPAGWTLEYSQAVGTGDRHFIHKLYALADGASVSITSNTNFGSNTGQVACVVLDGSVHSDFGALGTVTTRPSASNDTTAVSTGTSAQPNLVVSHEKTTSQTSITPNGYTAIVSQVPVTGKAGSVIVGHYDDSAGPATKTTTYGGTANSNGAAYQVPVVLKQTQGSVAVAIGSTLTIGGVREADAAVAVSIPSTLAATPSGQQTATVAVPVATSLAIVGQREADAAMPIPVGSTLAVVPATPVQGFLVLPLPEAAHRGGSGDWPEETLFAYVNAAAWNPQLALEASVWQSSDGVWVLSHDQNTSRVFGTSMDIPTSTWAALSSLTTTVGNKPIGRLDDMLAAQATGNRVLFIDNKGQQDIAGLLSLLATYGGPARFILKGYYSATSWATAATANGYQSWGYWFPADTAAGNLNSTTAARWTLLGLQYDDTSTQWTAALGFGKPVFGHIIATLAQASTATGKGATGLMVSGVQAVVPHTGSGSEIDVTVAVPVASTLAVTGQHTAQGLVAVPVASGLAVGVQRQTFAAVAVTLASALAVGAQREADSAIGVAIPLALALTGRREADAAIPIPVASLLDVQAAGQKTATVAITLAASLAVGVTREADAAVAIALASALAVGAGRETHAGVPLVVGSTLAVGAVREADAAIAMVIAAALGVAGQRQLASTVPILIGAVLAVALPTGSLVRTWDGTTWRPAVVRAWDGASWRPAARRAWSGTVWH